MNKKLVGGLFALLFVTSGVQTLAISKLQKTVGPAQTQVVAMTSAQNSYNLGNQQAAVGQIISTPDDPQSVSLEYIFNLNGTCEINVIDDDGVVLNTYNGTTTIDSTTGALGCWIGLAPNLDGSGDTGYVIVSMEDGILTISSLSAVLATQFKLSILGFLSPSGITGKLDVKTQSAIKNFQKSVNISQTGKNDQTTQASIDKIFKSGKVSELSGYYIEISK